MQSVQQCHFPFLTNKRRAGNGSLETMFETCGFPDVTFRRLDMINEKLTRTSKDPFPVPLFESQHRLSDPLKMGGVKRLKAREGAKVKISRGQRLRRERVSNQRVVQDLLLGPCHVLQQH